VGAQIKKFNAQAQISLTKIINW